jgi:hypothetical protein
MKGTLEADFHGKLFVRIKGRKVLLKPAHWKNSADAQTARKGAKVEFEVEHSSIKDGTLKFDTEEESGPQSKLPPATARKGSPETMSPTEPAAGPAVVKKPCPIEYWQCPFCLWDHNSTKYDKDECQGPGCRKPRPSGVYGKWKRGEEGRQGQKTSTEYFRQNDGVAPNATTPPTDGLQITRAASVGTSERLAG